MAPVALETLPAVTAAVPLVSVGDPCTTGSMLCLSDPQATPKSAGTATETNKVQIRTLRCEAQLERIVREGEGAVMTAARLNSALL